MIFFDTCLSGSVEVFAEVRRYAKTFVASALPVPGRGWNYTWFLQATRRLGPQTPEEWAQLAVLAYDMTYDQRFYPKPAQLVAVRSESDFLERLRAVNQRILNSDGKLAPELLKALRFAQAVGEEESLDLGQVLVGLQSFTADPELKQECLAFLESYHRATIGISMPPKDGKRYTGLTIWAPRQRDPGGVRRYYDKLQFHKETGWFDVLKLLLGEVPVETT